jgi:hypothetical protein
MDQWGIQAGSTQYIIAEKEPYFTGHYTLKPEP